MAEISKLRYQLHMKDQVSLSISLKFEEIIFTNSKDMNIERCAVDAI